MYLGNETTLQKHNIWTRNSSIPKWNNDKSIAVKEYRVLTKDTNQMTQFNQCFDIKVQGI